MAVLTDLGTKQTCKFNSTMHLHLMKESCLKCHKERTTTLAPETTTSAIEARRARLLCNKGPIESVGQTGHCTMYNINVCVEVADWIENLRWCILVQ